MSNGMTDQVLRQKLKDCEANLESSDAHYAALAPLLTERDSQIETLQAENRALRDELEKMRTKLGLPLG